MKGAKRPYLPGHLLRGREEAWAKAGGKKVCSAKSSQCSSLSLALTGLILLVYRLATKLDLPDLQKRAHDVSESHPVSLKLIVSQFILSTIRPQDVPLEVFNTFSYMHAHIRQALILFFVEHVQEASASPAMSYIFNRLHQESTIRAYRYCWPIIMSLVEVRSQSGYADKLKTIAQESVSGS